MMEPLRDELCDLLRGVRLSAPGIPYLSNVTGAWVTPEQATDPEFWVRHLVEPVRFGDSLAERWTTGSSPSISRSSSGSVSCRRLPGDLPQPARLERDLADLQPGDRQGVL